MTPACSAPAGGVRTSAARPASGERRLLRVFESAGGLFGEGWQEEVLFFPPHRRPQRGRLLEEGGGCRRVMNCWQRARIGKENIKIPK